MVWDSIEATAGPDGPRGAVGYAISTWKTRRDEPLLEIAVGPATGRTIERFATPECKNGSGLVQKAGMSSHNGPHGSDGWRPVEIRARKRSRVAISQE